MIYDFDKRLPCSEQFLPEDLKDFLGRIAERFPQIGIEVQRPGQMIIVGRNSIIDNHIKEECLDFIDCGLDQVPSDRWIKVLFAVPYDRLAEFEPFTQQMDGRGVDFLHSWDLYYEMLPAGITKGFQLPRLCDMIGVSLANTAAIGDYRNDREMIIASGFGAAVGNALPEIKEAADYITADNDSDAIAELIGMLMG